MDLPEFPDYRRVLSNQGDGRRDKVNKTKSQSYHQTHHTHIKHKVLTSLSEPIIRDYTQGKLLNGKHQTQHVNGANVNLPKQFPDKTVIKPGNSLFASRKIGPLHRKFCDTDKSCFVYGSEDIRTGNSKKITHSESSSSGIWQDGAKLLGIQRTNPKMSSRPEIRVLNESYVTSALATEDDSHLPLSSKSHFASKSNAMEKIGQVSVTLPPAGSSTIAASWKNYHMGITNPAAEHNGNRSVEIPGTSNHKNAFNNDHPEIGAREISLKLKALMKYDGLDKLREKVKRQQLASKENKKPENEVIGAAADDHFCMTGSPDVEDGNNVDGGSVMMEMEPHIPVRKASHHSRQNIADNDMEEDERHVKVRKIATSVSSPSYKGFTDLKRKAFDKNINATTKHKPKHTEKKVDSRNNDKVLTSITTTNTSDKCDSKTNVSEPVSDKTKPHRKDMITPSSWREGQEIIRRVLGPPQKVSTTKPKPFLANPDEINVAERKLTVGARQMLKDLQIHKNSEVNVTADLDEEKDNVPCPDPKPQGKPILHAVKRKPAKISESDKQAKVRHYDPEEVRKFIAKKKDERLRKAKEDQMATMNRCVKRQEMLQEVYRKQREATAAAQRKDASSSRCKSKNEFAKTTDIIDNPAFDLDLSVGGSSDLHLNFSDATSILTANSHDGSMTPQITPQITPRSESSPAVPPVKSKSFSGKFHTNRTYPRPLSQNLELNSSSRKNNPSTVAASSTDMFSSAHNLHPASYSGQIDLSNRRRILDIHSSAATLTNKLREIYKQTSASDFSPPPPAHDECYSPSLDILSGTGPTYVGTMLDDNLPGVQSLRLKAQEIYEKKEQVAATRIQAVYRGYTVRKNLKWQHITGLPDVEDQVPSNFQTNFYQDQSDTSSVDCGLAENSFGFSKAPKFKSLFHQHFTDPQIDSQNHTSYTKEIKEHKHQPRSSTLYPKYPWKDAASDQFSIVNIFTSKYKNLIQTDSDHSSDAATEKHMTKLHSPGASSVSSIGSHQRLSSQLLSANQQQHHNYAEPTSYLAKPVKTDLHLEVKEKELSIKSEKNKNALLDPEELSHLSSENVSSHLGATRSRSSHKSGSRRGSSARKKLNLYKVSSKSLHAESHTDTSLQSFSEDSEMDNRSTSEAPLRSQSSMGDSTDSDVSSLLNEQSKVHANSRLFSYSHPLRKDAADHSTVSKRYAPSTLPMRLRAELYNFEQTVETVSLAQQETFSLGHIFQKQQQKQDQEMHYWDRLKHAVELLEGKTTVPTSQMPEHSEALMSGDQSFSLKSITAHEEKNGLPKHETESPSTQTHTYSKVIPSTTESLSNTNISESLYTHSHTKHSSSAGGKYSTTISTSQTESKRPSHRKNIHHSSHRGSHRSDESSSSRGSVKTASDVRVGDETSDSIAEDISDGSIIEASSVNMSVSKQPQHHSNKQSRSKEAWKIQLEEEKQRAQKEDAIWQSKLKEVEEKLNSLQHPLVRKELDEVLPELVKRKLVVLDEVPRMMVELKELTDRQELSRKEHYKRVKSLLKSQAKYSESKLHSSRDSSKSDSEIYGHPKATKENGSSSKHDSMGDMYTSKQKCLSEKKLEIQALEKRLKHEEKYLHKLKKETLKKCAEPNVNSSGSVIASSIKEDLSENKEKHNSRRRFDNFSHSSDHSVSEALNATTNSLPASFSKGYSLLSGGGGGGGKNSISEEIQEKFSQASNSSKSKKQSISVKESSIAEDIDSHSRKDNSHTRKDNSSYSKKTKASASESGDDTATNDEYSRSFETSISSSYRASPVHQLPRPLVGTRNGSLSFRSSRSSKGRRRGSESDTEDSFQSETLSDASDIEVRIRALSEDLKRKKNEADRLRQEKKAKYKEKLKAQEESLIKQIEAYDNYIEQIKEELQKEQEPSTKKGVKPQIKQPKVSESRKFKQISTPDVSPAQMSKRDSTGSSADETLSPMKHEFQPETSICSGTLSPRFQTTSKADISKQSASPVASHIVQQSSSNEGHNTTTTTEIKINSIPEELDEKTVSSSKSVNISGLSKMTNKELSTSCKEVLNSVRVDSLAELASKESLQTSTKTADKPKNNEDQVDSQQAPSTVQSRHFTSEISESISEKIETIASSGVLSKSNNNDKAILKLNLNEESSSQPVNAASEAEQHSQDSVKAKDKPADSTSFSEHYSEDFEVDKTISSQHSQSFDDLDDDEEMSQYSLDRTVSEAEQGDEISEQISVHSDTSSRTSLSKSITISNRQRGVPDGQFDNSASQTSVTPESCLHREPTENSSHSELQENENATLSVDIEQQQPLQDSENVALNKTSEKIENVVDEILNKFVSESVSTICKIAAGKKETIASVKKAAPPVLPKPKRKNLPDQNQSVTHTATSAARAAAVNDEKPMSDRITTSMVLKESKSLTQAEESSEKSKRIKQELTNNLMESLLSESIKKVLDVRRRKKSNAKIVSPVTSPREIIIDENKITSRRQSLGFEVSAFSLDDDPFLWSLSPESESSDDFPPADCDDFDKIIPRPHSPLPNEPKPSLLSDDITENIWPDLVPCKPPPPYPGHADADTTLELQKLSKEFYAVPQKRDEIDQLVSSAVELFWQDRANDRPLTDTTMPDCFLTVTDDLVSEMDQQSCRSYKKMLFDLTREIIEEVYEGDTNNSQDNDGNNNNNPAKNRSRHPMAKLIHRKCQPVINKYYRQSRSPPSTPEELQRVVKDAVAGLLQLEDAETETGSGLGSGTNGNAGRKRQEFDKWKTSKKDHVDRILIQELQEEEPQWVDYDTDVHELKVQLTNTIFDSLLSKTVETFRNIYNRRNQRQQQQQQQQVLF